MAVNDWFNKVNNLKEFGKDAMQYATGLAKSAGTSLVGNSINHMFESILMDKQYALNEKAAQNAHQRQIDFWNMQNSYNDPSSQMRRLRNAGLNPGMLNGNVVNQAGNLSSVPSASVSKGSAGSQMSPSDVLALAQQKLSTKMLEKQVEAQDIANERARRESMFEDETFQNRVKTIQESLDALKLSNASARRIAEYEKDAYYDEDGHLVNNPKALEYAFKQLEKNILQNDELASNFTTFLKDCFGWDYTYLPDYIKAQISRYFWSFIRGEKMDQSEYDRRVQIIQSAIDRWLSEENNKHEMESHGDTYNLADDLSETASRFGDWFKTEISNGTEAVVGWASRWGKSAYNNFIDWWK